MCQIAHYIDIDICTLTQSLPCCCLLRCLFFSFSACPQTDTAQFYNTHLDSCTQVDRTGLEFHFVFAKTRTVHTVNIQIKKKSNFLTKSKQGIGCNSELLLLLLFFCVGVSVLASVVGREGGSCWDVCVGRVGCVCVWWAGGKIQNLETKISN